jgi:hypothetical protein
MEEEYSEEGSNYSEIQIILASYGTLTSLAVFRRALHWCLYGAT